MQGMFRSVPHIFLPNSPFSRVYASSLRTSSSDMAKGMRPYQKTEPLVRLKADEFAAERGLWQAATEHELQADQPVQYIKLLIGVKDEEI